MFPSHRGQYLTTTLLPVTTSYAAGFQSGLCGEVTMGMGPNQQARNSVALARYAGRGHLLLHKSVRRWHQFVQFLIP